MRRERAVGDGDQRRRSLVGANLGGGPINPPISFFLIVFAVASTSFFLSFSVRPTNMSTDTRSHRDREAPPKRKTRDGSEDVPQARKKVHRKADKADGQVQFEEYSKGDVSKPKVTRKYKDKFAPKPEKEYPSINDLKKRIRDVKRLLNKIDLSADARILQERALAGYEQDLADETRRRERSSLIKKYHFVRFLGMWICLNDLVFLANVLSFY